MQLSPTQLSTMSSGMGSPNTAPAPTTPTGGKLTTQQLQQMSSGMKDISPSIASKATPNDSWAAYDAQNPTPEAVQTSKDNLSKSISNLPGISGYMHAGQTGGTNFVSNWAGGIKDAVGNVVKDVTSNPQGGSQVSTPGQALTSGSKTALDVTNAVLSPITGIISPVLKPIVDSLGEGAANNPVVAQGLNAVNGLIDKFPQTAEVAGNLFQTFLNMAGIVGGGTKAGEVPVKSPEMVGPTTPVDASTLPPRLGGPEPVKTTTPVNESSVLDNYNRSIKPTVSGKGNAGAIAKANSQVSSGLKAIYDNKPNLKFTDENGTEITGQTPKTVSQLSDSIAQTKQSLYDQYNKLATEAGQKGLTINTRNIGMELDPVINSKSLAISNPSAIKYAQDLQTRLWKNGELDSKTAQEVIQNYNTELKNFYRNPTPGMASNIQVDAMVANMLRKQLDDGITSATGEAYQPLKNQYGALSSMEADVARKAQQIAKQNNVTFVSNLSNIASGAQLIKGLMTGSVVDTAMGGGIKAIQLYNKYLNNPDRGVSNIFNEFDRAGQSSSAANSTMPNSTANTTASTGDNAQSMKNNNSQTITNPTTSKTTSPVNKGITPKSGLANKQGGFIDPVKMAKDVKAFIKTTPPYGLLQDLKSFVDLHDFGTLPIGETDKNQFMLNVRTQLEKHGVDAFNMTDRKIADFADAVLNKANQSPKKK